jgi:hypothetical protein
MEQPRGYTRVLSRLSTHEQKPRLRVSEAECDENRTFGLHGEVRKVILPIDSHQFPQPASNLR